MRHRKKDSKLGRSPAHKKATLASLVCALIEQRRIKTTLPKAKQARRLAEKMITVGRKYHSAATPEAKLAVLRRTVTLLGRRKPASLLINDVVPGLDGRNGGYTRVLKLGRRRSDGSEMATLEWVGTPAPENKKKKDKSSGTDKAAA